MERLPRTTSYLALAGALLISGCSAGETEPKLALGEQVAPEAESSPDVYKFAYKIGFMAGCNPETYLDEDGNLLLVDDVDVEAYNQARERDPEAVEAGIKAGIEEGLNGFEQPDSEIC